MADIDQTDAELISASARDPTLFGAIYERHHDPVFRFAARRVGSQDAPDVTADTFVRAFEIRHRYDPAHPSCLPWLYGIAQNLVGDRLRRVRRRSRAYVVAESHNTTFEYGEEADARIVAASMAGLLNEALRQLSNRDRNTLLLYALEGLSYSEIARTLEIPPGTVGSRISRARRQISELIPDLAQRTAAMTLDDLNDTNE